MEARPTMYVMVGLPGTGKTTRARELETQKRALRLTPDEWMLPLFGEPEADGKRFVLEGRFLWLAMRALRLGVSIVLDFGVWSKDERSALRWLADQAGGHCELVYLAMSEEERRQQVEARFAADPGSTFEETCKDFDRHARQFQVPDEHELTSTLIDIPPNGYDTWGSWAAERWPSSVP